MSSTFSTGNLPTAAFIAHRVAFREVQINSRPDGHRFPLFVFDDESGRALRLKSAFEANGHVRVADFLKAQMFLHEAVKRQFVANRPAIRASQTQAPTVDPSKPLMPEFWNA